MKTLIIFLFLSMNLYANDSIIVSGVLPFVLIQKEIKPSLRKIYKLTFIDSKGTIIIYNSEFLYNRFNECDSIKTYKGFQIK